MSGLFLLVFNPYPAMSIFTDVLTSRAFLEKAKYSVGLVPQVGAVFTGIIARSTFLFWKVSSAVAGRAYGNRYTTSGSFAFSRTFATGKNLQGDLNDLFDSIVRPHTLAW